MPCMPFASHFLPMSARVSRRNVSKLCLTRSELHSLAPVVQAVQGDLAADRREGCPIVIGMTGLGCHPRCRRRPTLTRPPGCPLNLADNGARVATLEGCFVRRKRLSAYSLERVAACSVHPAAGGGLEVQLILEVGSRQAGLEPG